MPDTPTSFVAAYRLDGQGGGAPLTHQQLATAWLHDAEPIWMHLDFSFTDANDYLQGIAALSDDVIEALLEEDTRPRVARFPGGMMTTLRGINLTPGSAPEDMLSLRVWLTPHRLITLRRRPLQSIQRVREFLDAGEGARNVAELLAGMADMMVDQVGELSHRLDNQLGELEENQLNDASLDSDDLARVRRPLITLRRFMEPQSHCLSKLADETSGLDETARLWLRESANLLYRYVEDFNAMQERALILQEQIWNEHNERLNERMYLLAIITAVFLPLTFLTGLLGINVGGIPGANSPIGFAAVVALSMAVGAGVMALLKRWQWW